MRAGTLSRRVAEVLLGMEPAPEQPEQQRQEPAPFEMNPAALVEYAGTYYSPELEASYMITVEAGRLKASHIRHGDQWLTPTGKDEFRGEGWWFDRIDFVRDSEGKVSGFTVTDMPRVRNVRFIRQ
jgi:hypothetical protein